MTHATTSQLNGDGPKTIGRANAPGGRRAACARELVKPGAVAQRRGSASTGIPVGSDPTSTERNSYVGANLRTIATGVPSRGPRR